jgi:hypothetical protein
MKVLDIFYYYYLSFYKKIINDPEPHFATVLALSFSQSLLINGIMDIVALKFFCYEIKVVVQFLILLLIIFLNYFLYHRKGRAYDIIKESPIIGNSKTLSILITILFFLVTTSWLFWGPIYGKHLLSQCK